MILPGKTSILGYDKIRTKSRNFTNNGKLRVQRDYDANAIFDNDVLNELNKHISEIILDGHWWGEYGLWECTYCGTLMTNLDGRSKLYGLTFDHDIHLDGPDKHVKENVIRCCTNCNKAKWEFDDSKFLHDLRYRDMMNNNQNFFKYKLDSDDCYWASSNDNLRYKFRNLKDDDKGDFHRLKLINGIYVEECVGTWERMDARHFKVIYPNGIVTINDKKRNYLIAMIDTFNKLIFQLSKDEGVFSKVVE